MSEKESFLSLGINKSWSKTKSSVTTGSNLCVTIRMEKKMDLETNINFRKAFEAVLNYRRVKYI